MSDIALPIEEFQALVQPLVGLPVSLPWKGYGSAIFLELGELAPLKSSRRHHNEGQACISVEWDWRVEAETRVLYGSSNSGPKIASGIMGLQGTTLHGLFLVGQVPELVVQFSNGHRLCSMSMQTGDPEWSIKLPDKRWVYAKRGSLLIGSGGSETSEQEKSAFALAERTASRWGIPTAEHRGGSCATCASFVALDGQGHMLDYGACLAEGGPFDGRVVNRDSGCPFFSSFPS